MHDHDDPKRCSVCRGVLHAVESYGEILNLAHPWRDSRVSVSIESSVQQYLDAFDWAEAVNPGVSA